MAVFIIHSLSLYENKDSGTSWVQVDARGKADAQATVPIPIEEAGKYRVGQAIDIVVMPRVRTIQPVDVRSGRG